MSQDPCKKYACELQYCLQANNYTESKCDQVISKLIKCCQDFYLQQDNNKTSPSPPLPNLHVSEHCSGFIQLDSRNSHNKRTQNK